MSKEKKSEKSASDQCKKAGLDSLSELIDTIKENDTEKEWLRVERWLHNISKSKPQLFLVLVEGAMHLKKNKKRKSKKK